MTTILGDLLLELKLDDRSFRETLDKAKADALRVGSEIESSLGRTNGLNLSVKVDDRSLTDLNKHLDLKKRHFQEVQGYMNSNPLKPRVDLSDVKSAVSEISAFKRSAGDSVQGSVSISKTFSGSDLDLLSSSIEAGCKKGFTSAQSSFGRIFSGSIEGVFSGINGILTAPFKAIGSVFTTVLSGVGLTIGNEISKDLAKGLFKGIEDEFSYLVGSFDFLGKSIGKGLSEDLVNSLGNDIEGVSQNLKAFLGEDEVRLEGFISRKDLKLDENHRKDLAKYLAKNENKEFWDRLPELNQERDRLSEEAESIDSVSEKLKQKILEKYQSTGGKTLDDRIDTSEASLRSIAEKQASASTSGLSQVEIDNLNAVYKEEAKVYARLWEKKRELQEKAMAGFKKESEEIKVRSEKFAIDVYRFRNATDTYYNSSILEGAPKRDPREIGVGRQGVPVQAANQVLNSGIQKAGKTQSYYERIVEKVAKVSGITLDPEAIPRLVEDESLAAEGRSASYQPNTNTIRVPKNIVDQIKMQDLGDKEFETIVHELRHAMQKLFGELSGTMDVAVDLISATEEEAVRLGSRIENSTEGNKGFTKEYNRAIEEDAYVFADRNAKNLKRELLDESNSQRFIDSVGVGGGKLKNLHDTNRLKIVGMLRAITKDAGVALNEEIDAFISKDKAISEKLSKILASIPDRKSESEGDLAGLATNLETEVKSLSLELIAALDSFKKDAASKPQKIRDTARDAMVGFSKKKELVPIAQKLGIEGVEKLSKKDLIDQISAHQNIDQMSGEVFSITRRKAAEQIRRQEAAEDRKIAAMAAARKAGEISRRVADAGKVAAQSPAGQAIAQVAGVVGKSAQIGYKVLEGAESLALDFVPGGRTMKAIGQKAVLPAVAFGAAQHLLPGGEMVAHALQGTAQGALSPIADSAAHMLGGQAGQAAANLMPNLFGLKAQVASSVSAGVEGLLQGAASAAIDAAVAVTGGKVLQQAASKPLKLAAKPLALPAGGSGESIEAMKEQFLALESKKEQIRQTVSSQGGVVSTLSTPKAPRIQPKAPDLTSEPWAGDGPPIKTTPEASAISRAKAIAEKVRKGYADLKTAVKRGDDQMADAMIKTIDTIAVQATAEISEIAESMNLEKTFLTGEEVGRIGNKTANQINNAKAQISRAKNLANQEKIKLEQRRKQSEPKTIDVEAYAFEDINNQINNLIALIKSIPGGDIASMVGGTVAGMATSHMSPEVAAAIGTAGSIAARQAYNLGGAAISAHSDIKEDESYKSLGAIEKFGAVLNETTQRLRSLQGEMADGLTGDVAGSAISLLADELLGSIPLLSAAPMKGAAVASVVVPAVNERIKAFRTPSFEEEDLSAFNGISDLINELLKNLSSLTARPDDLAEVNGHMAKASFEMNHDKFQKAEEDINFRASKPLDLDPETASVEKFSDRIVSLIRSLDILGSFKEKIAGLAFTLFKVGSTFSGLISSFLGLQALSLVVPLMRDFTLNSIEAARAFTAFKTGIEFATGGELKASKEIAFLNSTVDKLSLPLGTARDSFKQLAASTKDTASEGQITRDLFEGVAQASTVLGLSAEQTGGAINALSQMASKGVVSMEELRQQLGERIPGIMNIAARAMGMSVSDFNKLVGSGGLTFEEFAPRFQRQLKSEFSGGAEQAANSSLGAQNRFQNEQQRAMETFGRVIDPAVIAFFNMVTGAVKVATIAFSNLDKILTGIVSILPGMGSLMGTVIPSFGSILAGSASAIPGLLSKIPGLIAQISTKLMGMMQAIAPFVARFLVINALIETGRGLFESFMPDDLTKKFEGFTEGAIAGLKKIEDAADKAAGKVAKVAEPTDLKSKGVDLTFGMGGAIGVDFKTDDVIKWLRTGFDGKPDPLLGGMATVAEKQFNDQLVAAGEYAMKAQDIAGKVFDTRGTNDAIAKVKAIDSQINTLDLEQQRLQMQPEVDSKAIDKINEQKRALMADRDNQAAGLVEQGTQVDAQIKNIKKMLEEIDAQGLPADKAAQLKAQLTPTLAILEKAQAQQEKFNKRLSEAAVLAANFGDKWQEALDKQVDAAQAIDTAAMADKTALAAGVASGEINQGQMQSMGQSIEANAIAAKLQTTRDTIDKLNKLMGSIDAPNTLKSAGIDEGAGIAELRTKEKEVSNPKVKQAITSTIQLKEIEQQRSQLELQLAESASQISQAMREATKQANEFYKNIARQGEDMAATIAQMKLDQGLTEAKTKIKGALNAFEDTFIGEFANKIVEMLEMVNQKAKNAADAQNDILNRMRQLEDLKNQGADIIANAPSAIDASGSIADSASGFDSAPNAGNARKVVVNRTGQVDENGLEKLLVRTYDASGKIVGQLMANSGIRSTQGNFGQQARDVSGTNNPLPYGRYAIGDTVSAPNIPGYGRMTTIVTPKFDTARAGIEVHVDGNRATSPGSAGCLVFATEAEFEAFQKALKLSGAQELVFESGVAATRSLSSAGGLPSVQQKNPSRNSATQGTPSGKGGSLNKFFGINNEADLYRLAVTAITEGLSGNVQSQIDTAVAMGNRVQAGKWGKTASQVVSAPGQFEAWTRFGLQGVSDRSSAIAALNKNGYQGEQVLDRFVAALNNPQAVLAGISHIKGSTDYRAYVPGQTLPAQAGDPQRSRNDNYYIPGGTNQASVSAAEAAKIYQSGRSFVGSGGSLGGMPMAQAPGLSSEGIGEMNRANADKINKSLGISEQQLNEYKAAIEGKLKTDNAAIDQQLAQALKRNQRFLKTNVDEQELANITAARKIEDEELALGPQTAQKQLKKDLLGVTREKEDFNRQSTKDIEKAQMTLDDAKTLRDTLASSMKAGALPESIGKPSIEALDKEIPRMAKNLEEARRIATETGKALDAKSNDIRQKYEREQQAVALENEKRMGGLIGEERSAQVAAVNLKAESSKSLDDRQKYQMESLILTQQSSREEIGLNLKSQLFEIDELVRSQKISTEEADRLKKLYQSIADTKLGNLTLELQKQTEEMAKQREELRLNSATQLLGSRVNLAKENTEWMRWGGNDEGARAQEYQIALAQNKFDMAGQVRSIDKAVESGQLLGSTAIEVKANLEKLNQVKLDNLKNQFDPEQILKGKVIQGLKGQLQGVLQGIFSGEGIDFSGLMNKLADMSANLLAESITEMIMGNEKGVISADELGAGIEEMTLPEQVSIAADGFTSGVNQAGQTFHDWVRSAISSTQFGSPSQLLGDGSPISSGGGILEAMGGSKLLGGGTMGGLFGELMGDRAKSPAGGLLTGSKLLGGSTMGGLFGGLTQSAEIATSTLTKGVESASTLLANSGSGASTNLLGGLSNGLPGVLGSIGGMLGGGGGILGAMGGSKLLGGSTMGGLFGGGAAKAGGGFLGGWGGMALSILPGLLGGLFGKKKKQEKSGPEEIWKSTQGETKNTRQRIIEAFDPTTKISSATIDLMAKNEIKPTKRVKNFLDGNLSDMRIPSSAAIADALRREGPNGMVSVVNPDELILSQRQTQRFFELGLDRVFDVPNYRSGNLLELRDRVPNFSGGGVVGGSSITVPTTVNINGGGDGSGIDVPRFKDVLNAEIQRVIHEQKAPGGSLEGLGR